MKPLLARILCALGLHRWQHSRHFYAGPVNGTFKCWVVGYFECKTGAL